jgi:hypothetical protein
MMIQNEYTNLYSEGYLQFLRNQRHNFQSKLSRLITVFD